MAKIFNFPGTGPNSPPMHLEPNEGIFGMLEATDTTHHTEVFSYNDDSYVVLVQPKAKPFDVERVVFMAERLKMEAFDALPVYDDDEFDDDDSDDLPA